jgi:light-regulated signal transduction histidine kinase (bacteriophytochrome)
MEQRDYSRRAIKMSGDEVGVLVESFNGMLAEIERRTRALEASNRELEKEVAERGRAEQKILWLNEKLEERVRDRTAELEFSNQELEAFCYSVSHDLRAPLRGIDGFSQLLVEDFADKLPDEGKTYLSRIRSATHNMGELIEGLLNLSRVARGTLERKKIDLTELAKHVVSDLQHRDPARSVETSIWEGMTVEADPRLVRAILENLIGNSWKFTARTAKARIEIGALHDGARVTFFVRDNGAGFDMAYADKLFREFQRLHPTKDFSGTGIGLATVQRIVVRHGGRVWADAKVGQGAVFFFTLSPESEQVTSEQVVRETA